jgi:thiol-disulfide isomerase/thioredoxin
LKNKIAALQLLAHATDAGVKDDGAIPRLMQERGVLMKRLMIAVGLMLVTLNISASEFVLKDLQGNVQRLSAYKGKWVLVNFWATWCPPCLEEIPDLVEMHDARKTSDFVVIGIAMSSSLDSVNAFARQMEISYPIVMGDDRIAAQIGKVEALPTSYLYDPSGRLVSYQAGMVTRVAIENYIRAKSKK